MSVDKSSKTEKRKKPKKLYRCPECTNSVMLRVAADVTCTRCNIAMRLFEAEQKNLFEALNRSKEK